MANKFPPIVNIRANGLPDAWHKAIKECLTIGAIENRDSIKTKDIVSLIEVGNPLQEPVLHPESPAGELHLKEFLKQWERGYKWKDLGFPYNYIDRLINYPTTDISSRNDGYFKVSRPFTQSIDQLKVISERITERIKNVTKTGECIVNILENMHTWVPERDLFVKEEQPSLQNIRIFIHSYPKIIKAEEREIIAPGKGEFMCTWLSRDLYSSWNLNMIGLTLMLNREIFEPNNIKIARCIDFSSLYICESDWDTANKVKSVNTTAGTYEE